MIGLVFDSNNRAKLLHYEPDKVGVDFDLVVESLPDKDPTKSDMKADLYRDSNDNLSWQYSEITV